MRRGRGIRRRRLGGGEIARDMRHMSKTRMCAVGLRGIGAVHRVDGLERRITCDEEVR